MDPVVDGMRLGPKGPLYVERVFGITYAVRLDPPRCWESTPSKTALWSATGGPPFSPGAALRELRDEARGLPVDPAPEAAWRRAERRRLFDVVDEPTKNELASWGGGTWNLYRLLRCSPEARELAHTEEGRRLAWVCAQADMLFEAPWKQARAHAQVRRLLRLPRKEVAGALGFPAANATVRAIGRIVPATMNRKALRMFVWMLADEQAARRAAHLRQLSAVAIGTLISSERHRVGDELLREIAEDNAFPEAGGSDCEDVNELLNDSVACAAVVGRRVPVFRTLEDLRFFHDDVVLAYRWARQLSEAPLPAAPDVFTSEERRCVRPLRSLFEWGAEGRALRHCLGASDDHCRRAMEGTLVAWAIEGPERLTLAVHRDDTETWYVFDLRGVRNCQPSAQARWWANDVVRRLNARSAAPADPPGAPFPSR